MHIDLHDPDVYARGVPHEQFAWLRENDPVRWHEEPGGPGFWALTRHADLVRMSKDVETYSSHLGGAMLEDYPSEELDQHRMLMLNQDPPDHSRLRTPAEPPFARDALGDLAARIRAACDELLEPLLWRAHGDFSKEVATRLPTAVYAELLGAPAADRKKIASWVGAMTGVDGPRDGRSMTEDVSAVAGEIFGYVHALAVARRAEPSDDVLSGLAAAMSPFDIALLFIQLANSGTEAPGHLAAGTVLALLEHPAQWEMLQSDRSLLDTAVEEGLRWVSPVIYCRRTARVDTELHGRRIKAGDKVVGFYSSAHRDPEAFPNPFTFDVTRTENPQIDFGGGGPHYCLGRHVARLQLRVLLETVLDRAPNLRLAGEVTRLRSNAISGITSLPVTL
jgi:cholest-4-en-3-one 26-monooxygenase